MYVTANSIYNMGRLDSLNETIAIKTLISH